MFEEEVENGQVAGAELTQEFFESYPARPSAPAFADWYKRQNGSQSFVSVFSANRALTGDDARTDAGASGTATGIPPGI